MRVQEFVFCVNTGIDQKLGKANPVLATPRDPLIAPPIAPAIATKIIVRLKGTRIPYVMNSVVPAKALGRSPEPASVFSFVSFVLRNTTIPIPI